MLGLIEGSLKLNFHSILTKIPKLENTIISTGNGIEVFKIRNKLLAFVSMVD